MHPYTNRLVHETSPYLLQHAHNPVDWYPWGEEAFERAKREDKPVLVSIGYAACHWCHVMERESFENPEVAALMNEHFINIKVDREERPDVDHTYMDAVQAISGTGGWPLNVFLTPDKRPFYGGTYYPPNRAFNRPSWTEILLAISQSYKERKDEVEQNATQLTEHLKASNSFGLSTAPATSFERAQVEAAFRNCMKTADRQWGGFGRAPKFPQTFTINFLLNYHYIMERPGAGGGGNDGEALQQATLSLDKMIQGGIYDQVGGGFARYSTDTEWRVPHFEKMLYDNALLVSTLCDAWQLTGKLRYREVVEETLRFTERELMHPEGGFYSALDADSEGVEGKFYVWSYAEVQDLLGRDADLFCRYYDISPAGNWEGQNILWVKQPPEDFAAGEGITVEALRALIERGNETLLRKREERVRPGLDDKILLGWNALMNTAFSKAFAATGNRHYREVAERNMAFLLNHFRDEELFHHTWKNGQAKQPAFLDDYAYLVAALVELAQATANYDYLETAAGLTQTVVEQFSDEQALFFYFTHRGQSDVLVRKKEIYDGATPSGNAVMAYNLYRLSILYDRSEWRERAEAMLKAIGEVCIKYPTSFGVWLSLYFEVFSGTSEIAILGEEWEKYLGNVLYIFIPHKLVQASKKSQSRFPLLADKGEPSKSLIYLCKNYACQRPVSTIRELFDIM